MMKASCINTALGLDEPYGTKVLWYYCGSVYHAASYRLMLSHLDLMKEVKSYINSSEIDFSVSYKLVMDAYNAVSSGKLLQNFNVEVYVNHLELTLFKTEI